MNEEDILLSDDLSPDNSGSVYQVPVDEVSAHEASEERAKVMQAAPLLDELLDWFTKQITALDSIDGLDLESNVPLTAQLMGRQVAKAALESSRTNLAVLKDEYTN